MKWLSFSLLCALFVGCSNSDTSKQQIQEARLLSIEKRISQLQNEVNKLDAGIVLGKFAERITKLENQPGCTCTPPLPTDLTPINTELAQLSKHLSELTHRVQGLEHWAKAIVDFLNKKPEHKPLLPLRPRPDCPTGKCPYKV